MRVWPVCVILVVLIIVGISVRLTGKVPEDQMCVCVNLCSGNWNFDRLPKSYFYFLLHISLVIVVNLCQVYFSQPRWLSGIMRSRVHSLWLLVDHCVLKNWDRILVRAVKGLISRAGMVSICPLLWQRDVKLQQTTKQQPGIFHQLLSFSVHPLFTQIEIRILLYGI